MPRYKFLNTVAPQVVDATAAAAYSEVLGSDSVFAQATADCFICVSADGKWSDGSAPAAGKGHFMPAGSGLPLSGINPSHKIGVSAGTLYVSAIG